MRDTLVRYSHTPTLYGDFEKKLDDEVNKVKNMILQMSKQCGFCRKQMRVELKKHVGFDYCLHGTDVPYWICGCGHAEMPFTEEETIAFEVTRALAR